MHTKHMLTFRSPDFPAINGIHPEVIMINSHDRSSSFTFMIGLFRYICLNGLVVSDQIFESFRIRHIYYNFEEVEELANVMIDNIPNVLNWVTKLQTVQMTQNQQREFTVRAIASRFKDYVDDEGNVNVIAVEKAIDVDYILTPIRTEDNNNSVWAVYNRVQEKLMNGGFTRVSGKDSKVRRTRAITNIKLDIDMNKALWQLANEYLPD